MRDFGASLHLALNFAHSNQGTGLIQTYWTWSITTDLLLPNKVVKQLALWITSCCSFPHSDACDGGNSSNISVQTAD